MDAEITSASERIRHHDRSQRILANNIASHLLESVGHLADSYF
jgi:hypothetical protein